MLQLGNGQDQLKNWGLQLRFGQVPLEPGPREVWVRMDSPTTSPRDALKWSNVSESRKRAFASSAKESPRAEAIRLLSFIRDLPAFPPDARQGGRSRSRETITLAAGSVKTSPYRGRITGPIKFINQLLDTWHLKEESAGTLLGFEPNDFSYIDDVLRGFATLRGRDAKDRIAHLYQIRKSLSGLFQDETVENEWLRESQDVLSGKTPMDLLLEGSMENLLLVREYVELVVGK